MNRNKTIVSLVVVLLCMFGYTSMVLADTRVVLTISSNHIGASGAWEKVQEWDGYGEFPKEYVRENTSCTGWTYICTEWAYKKFNQRNTGLGFETDFYTGRNLTAVGGFYKDSYYSTAFYGGGMARAWLTKKIAIGILLEGVTSRAYRARSSKRVVLVGGFVATIEYGDFGLNFGMIPIKYIIKDSPVSRLYTLQATYKLF